MHIHQFREVTNPIEKRKGIRVYQCSECNYTLEERKIQKVSYYYVKIGFEDRLKRVLNRKEIK